MDRMSKIKLCPVCGDFFKARVLKTGGVKIPFHKKFRPRQGAQRCDGTGAVLPIAEAG